MSIISSEANRLVAELTGDDSHGMPDLAKVRFVWGSKCSEIRPKKGAAKSYTENAVPAKSENREGKRRCLIVIGNR